LITPWYPEPKTREEGRNLAEWQYALAEEICDLGICPSMACFKEDRCKMEGVMMHPDDPAGHQERKERFTEDELDQTDETARQLKYGGDYKADRKWFKSKLVFTCLCKCKPQFPSDTGLKEPSSVYGLAIGGTFY